MDSHLLELAERRPVYRSAHAEIQYQDDLILHVLQTAGARDESPVPRRKRGGRITTPNT
jgi:hypothetical protein